MELNHFEKDDVTFYELYVSCPICLDRGHNGLQSFLVHANGGCNGSMYCGDNGYFLCKKCGATSVVYNWQYGGCQIHSKRAINCLEEYGNNTADRFIIFSIIGQMVPATGIAWLQRFLEILQKQHL